MESQIWNEDCNAGLDRIPDESVDLVMMDPPYKLVRLDGRGAFGSNNRTYYGDLENISEGISDELLDKIVSKMRRVNLYVWCNKEQVLQYITYFNNRRGTGGGEDRHGHPDVA